MHMRTQIILTTLAVATIASPCARAEDTEAVIKNALSAAPAAVAKNASVITLDEKATVTVLKKGTNNFSCMPDDPTTPTNDPNCVDENGLAWTRAYILKEPPPVGKIGFGYMLQGESAASNADPLLTKPADGKWSEAGPHIMIFNAREMMAGYPKPGNKPDVTQPFVMWQDTPYEHLMIPVPGE